MAMAMATTGKRGKRQTRAAVPPIWVLLLRGAALQDSVAVCGTDSRELPVSQQGDNPNAMQEMATPQCSHRKFCNSACIDLLLSSQDIL